VKLLAILLIAIVASVTITSAFAQPLASDHTRFYQIIPFDDECETHEATIGIKAGQNGVVTVYSTAPAKIDNNCGWTIRDGDWKYTHITISDRANTQSCSFNVDRIGTEKTVNCSLPLDDGALISIVAKIYYDDFFYPRTVTLTSVDARMELG